MIGGTQEDFCWILLDALTTHGTLTVETFVNGINQRTPACTTTKDITKTVNQSGTVWDARDIVLHK